MHIKKEDAIVLKICILLLLLNLYFIGINLDCPFHPDYVQYTKSIERFYDEKVIDDNINGKYFYVYIMAILLTPFKLLGLNLLDGLVFVTSLFQILLVWMFYKCCNDWVKTALMATTLTFMTFIGQPETVIVSSVFLLLYFLFRDKPYSEFFICIASLVRLDSAIYYLFAAGKNIKRLIIPIGITLLQWLSGKLYYIHSDFGTNPYPLSAIYILILSYGFYVILFLGLAKPKDKLDCATHLIILLLFIAFLKFPSQKLFFFPVILSFLLYDFKFKSKWFVFPFIVFNIAASIIVLIPRTDYCTAQIFNEFAMRHESNIYFGVFQPYLDYYGTKENPPYAFQIGQNCSKSNETFVAEDWRQSQLLFLPYKYCLEKWDGRYE